MAAPRTLLIGRFRLRRMFLELPEILLQCEMVRNRYWQFEFTSLRHPVLNVVDSPERSAKLLPVPPAAYFS
jgi:hypothetical protein